ncbi:MAG: HEAT repeat domain-containing protein [Bacteroidota bacterium]
MINQNYEILPIKRAEWSKCLVTICSVIYSAYTLSYPLLLQATEQSEYESCFFVNNLNEYPIGNKGNLQKINRTSSYIEYNTHRFEQKKWINKVKNCMNSIYSVKTGKLAWKYINNEHDHDIIFNFLDNYNDVLNKESWQYYLSHINPYSIDQLVFDIIERKYPLEEVLPYLGKESLRRAYYYLIQTIKKNDNPNSNRLPIIIEGLCHLPKTIIEEEATTILKDIMINHSNTYTRKVAIKTLGAIGKQEDHDLVNQLLSIVQKNPDDIIFSSEAVKALKKLQNKNIFTWLASSFKEEKKRASPNYERLKKKIELMGHSGDSRSLALLLDMLKNPHLEESAAKGLGWLKQENAILDLTNRMNGVINTYNQHKGSFTEDQKEKEDHEEVGIGEQCEDIGKGIMLALGHIGSTNSLDIILRTLALDLSEHYQLYYTTVNALEALGQLNYTDESDRQKAQEALQEFLKNKKKQRFHATANLVLARLSPTIHLGKEKYKSIIDYFNTYQQAYRKLNKDLKSIQEVIHNSQEDIVTRQAASHLWLRALYRSNFISKEVKNLNNNTLQDQHADTQEDNPYYVLVKLTSAIPILSKNFYMLYIFYIICLVNAGMTIHACVKKKCIKWLFKIIKLHIKKSKTTSKKRS